MDTSKIVTLIIWATLVLIAYEVIKKYYGAGATGAGNTTSAESAANLLAFFNNPQTQTTGSFASIPASDLTPQGTVMSNAQGQDVAD